MVQSNRGQRHHGFLPPRQQRRSHDQQRQRKIAPSDLVPPSAMENDKHQWRHKEKEVRTRGFLVVWTVQSTLEDIPIADPGGGAWDSWSADVDPKEGAGNPGRRCFSGAGGGDDKGEGRGSGVAMKV